MNILVPIKQVPDTGLNLKIKEEKLDESSLKWILSPYDEFALEESLKLKDKFQGKLFVITLGPLRAKQALLTSLALGADEAFHLVMDPIPQNPLNTAQILKEKICEIPDLSLIFCGKLSADSNNFAVPQMLAGLLNFNFVSNINKLQYENGKFNLVRECGGGIEEVLTAPAPLLLSADKGLNEPRYPSLPGIMKAKKKPIHSQTVSTKIEENLQLIQIQSPPEKPSPQMLSGNSDEQVAKLVQLLRDQEKIL